VDFNYRGPLFANERTRMDRSLDVSSENHETEEQMNLNIRSALHFSIGRISLLEDQKDAVTGVRMSAEAISALTELAYQYATTSLASDLVCFSQHASRRTIHVDDVKLVARKSPDRLLVALESFCHDNDDHKQNSNTTTTTAKTLQRRKNRAVASKKAKQTRSGSRTPKKNPSPSESRIRKEGRDRLRKELEESSAGSSARALSSDDSEMDVDLLPTRKHDSPMYKESRTKSKEDEIIATRRKELLGSSSEEDDSWMKACLN
jgi:histone H3/H4